MSSVIEQLIQKGVHVPVPSSVEIAPEVSVDAVSPGTTIHPGCRIRGAETWIGENCELGREAPATIENCQLGQNVSLHGGYFSGAVFLDGATMGSGAHVRPGTLLEEEASGAHSVGFKQTVFLSYVTAGSLINFCDAFMAGGTSRKNHSEIGSSYVHFNFTPHQDKATPSLVGDVPGGVMLNQPPIFLGGQGGLVGPCRIGFGCVIPAGVVFRRDAVEPGQILFQKPLPASGGSRPYQQGRYGRMQRLVVNNLLYIGNMAALRQWYLHVRSRFCREGDLVFNGAVRCIDSILNERIRRLGDLAGKVTATLEDEKSSLPPDAVHREQLQLSLAWPEWQARLEKGWEGSAAQRDRFLSGLSEDGKYLEAIHGLDDDARSAGTEWLQGIVDEHRKLWQELPAEGA